MMSYRNGQKVLPRELLEKIQEYVQGELVYIPQKKNTRRSWGSKSGMKEQIRNRNREIIKLHQEGHSIEELMCIFFLSDESIKKIVYGSDERH